MRSPNLLLLVAVLLPPRSLDVLGEVVEERTVETPYGVVGPLAWRAGEGYSSVWVEPYTGLPTRTDPRATIYAAHRLGVKKILAWDHGIAVNAVLRRGQPLIAIDTIEWMSQQPNTFLDPLHTALAMGMGFDPRAELNLDSSRLTRQPTFCPQMTAALHTVLPFAPSAIYLGVDGPRRESAAEARMFRAWGVDVIGQNLTPEITLANELGICFAGLVTISDYSNDQALQPIEGEVRSALDATIRILPDFANQVSQLTACTCQE
jgi:5'-methylthioadenosine phosphorylase